MKELHLTDEEAHRLNLLNARWEELCTSVALLELLCILGEERYRLYLEAAVRKEKLLLVIDSYAEPVAPSLYKIPTDKKLPAFRREEKAITH